MSLAHEKFSAIGHTGITYWNPVSTDVLNQWILDLPLSSSSHILDVGCGRAELLLRIVERYGCHAVGIDIAHTSIEAARLDAQRRVSEGLLDLKCEPFSAAKFREGELDLAACIGSTHAITNFEQALRILSSLVRPGGLILIGEGYWKQEPDPDYLAFLKAEQNDLGTRETYILLAEGLGLEVLKSQESTPDAWSEYEDTYADNILRFIESNPDDPDADEMSQRIRAWREAYVKWGRDTMGFALYLLQKATS